MNETQGYTINLFGFIPISQSTVLSLVMLGVFGCVAGGIYILRKGNNRKRGMLMLVLAGVLAANVAILLVPLKS